MKLLFNFQNMDTLRGGCLTALLGILVTGWSVAEGDKQDFEAQAATALEQKDWQSAFDIARQQIKSHPDQQLWIDVALIAKMHMAAEKSARIRQSPTQLTVSEQLELKELSASVSKWLGMTEQDKKAALTGILPKVKQFASAHPDLPSGWFLQAQMAIVANRRLEGMIAARNLEALQSWQTENDGLLTLLSQLQVLGWMPAAEADSDQRKRLSEFAQRIGTLPQGQPSDEGLKTLFAEVKAFCRENPQVPNAWLVQYYLAAKMNRSIEFNIAKKNLVKPTKAAAPTSIPEK